MVDATEVDIENMQKAAALGGEYLDSIGKTDLATMTEDEYMTFIEVIWTWFQDAPPF